MWEENIINYILIDDILPYSFRSSNLEISSPITFINKTGTLESLKITLCMKRKPSKSKPNLPHRALEHKLNDFAAPSDNHYTEKLLFYSCKLFDEYK